MILNGLLNNIIIPIGHKLSIIYNQSDSIVNLPTIISFLMFSLINIPVNYFLDQKGIKMGFRAGLTFYVLGMFLVCFINQSFPLAIFGYIVFSLGQPFILNTPAKISSYWFFPKNRALATSILVGCSIIGAGVGFAIPTLVVNEDSSGQVAKQQIFNLYLGYTIAAGSYFIINFILMRAKPSVPASNIQDKEQLTLKQTFIHIKNDRNIWKFYLCYFLVYGSFQTFAASANFLIKPFGLSDLDISIAAIALILLGTLGAIISSIFLKRYGSYSVVHRICCIGSLTCIILFGIQLLIIDSAVLIKTNVAVLGFFLTPIIPVSYEIGCQIAFPIGEAQVTGLLNGGALIWAFISDSLLTLIIGFGDKSKSIIFIFVLAVFISIGNVLGFLVKIDLKRKAFEQSLSGTSTSTSSTRQPYSPTKLAKTIQMANNPGQQNFPQIQKIDEVGQYKNLQQDGL